MNKYQKEQCIHQIYGYYRPPSISDHEKRTIEQRFESAKNCAIEALELNIQNLKEITLVDMFPNYAKKAQED